MEFEIVATQTYESWFAALRDGMARKQIASRLFRLQAGHFGDCKPVGDGVHELRFFQRAGYRIYYARDGARLIVLLAGGDKSSQARDIEQAKSLWHQWQEK